MKPTDGRTYATHWATGTGHCLCMAERGHLAHVRHLLNGWDIEGLTPSDFHAQFPFHLIFARLWTRTPFKYVRSCSLCSDASCTESTFNAFEISSNSVPHTMSGPEHRIIALSTVWVRRATLCLHFSMVLNRLTHFQASHTWPT